MKNSLWFPINSQIYWSVRVFLAVQCEVVYTQEGAYAILCSMQLTAVADKVASVTLSDLSR